MSIKKEVIRMNIFEEILTEIKTSPYPLVIYGAGWVGDTMYNYLKKNNVNVHGFAVDRDFLPKDRSLNGLAIYDIDELLRTAQYNVLLAFVDCSVNKIDKLEKHENVNKCYQIDFVGKSAAGRDGQMYDSFLSENQATLTKLREDLSDEASKNALDEFIRQRNTGVFNKPYSRRPEYFDDEIISLSEDEVFVDCGAYDGDSILAFCDALKEKKIFGYKRIYAFEADVGNACRLRKNLSELKDVQIIVKGVYDRVCTLYFSESGTMGSKVTDRGSKIEATTIDETVGDEEVTFIKMDIEGCELKALRGAEKIIKRWKPKLAICVYHRVEDLITIPQYIRSLRSDYKLFYRNYCQLGLEAIIYAV